MAPAEPAINFRSFMPLVPLRLCHKQIHAGGEGWRAQPKPHFSNKQTRTKPFRPAQKGKVTSLARSSGTKFHPSIVLHASVAHGDMPMLLFREFAVLIHVSPLSLIDVA